MKKQISRVLTITLLITLYGCAATYKPIKPATLNYHTLESQDGIDFSYKYDVLREKGNKKYAKKEHNRGIKLIAVKVTNNTDNVINVGRDLAFYSGQSQIFPMEPQAIKHSIRQIVPAYLPYLLLTFTYLTVSDGSSVATFPIGLVLGPGITIGNMVVAGSANKKMLNELYDYNILSRDIQVGETVYGIIGVRDIAYTPISVKIKK
jgi:hypothetical protein